MPWIPMWTMSGSGARSDSRVTVAPAMTNAAPRNPLPGGRRALPGRDTEHRALPARDTGRDAGDRAWVRAGAVRAGDCGQVRDRVRTVPAQEVPVWPVSRRARVRARALPARALAVAVRPAGSV